MATEPCGFGHFDYGAPHDEFNVCCASIAGQCAAPRTTETPALVALGVRRIARVRGRHRRHGRHHNLVDSAPNQTGGSFCRRETSGGEQIATDPKHIDIAAWRTDVTDDAPESDAARSAESLCNGWQGTAFD